MSKYLVEASKKNGLFQPYDPQKYYLVSKERLSKMLLHPVYLAVWSAKWVSLELTPLDQLESIYGEIEIRGLRAARTPFFACILTAEKQQRKIIMRFFATFQTY